MIGFHEYISNQRSSRPEPHHSWQGERFVNWAGWAIAALSVVGAAGYYARWQDVAGALFMLFGATLLATMAYLRAKALERKRATLSQAVAAYERMLADAFP